MARTNLSLRAFNFVDWRDFPAFLDAGRDAKHIALYPPFTRMAFSRRISRNSDDLSRIHPKIRAFCRIRGARLLVLAGV